SPALGGEWGLVVRAEGAGSQDSWVLSLAPGGGQDSWLSWVRTSLLLSAASLEPDEVEDFLAEVLNNEFDTIIEDGSLAEVSQQLQSLFARCQRGEGPALTEAIARLTRRQQEVGRAAAQARPAEGSSSEEEEEERPEEVPAAGPRAGPALPWGGRTPPPLSALEQLGWE
uniref:Pre-rRNA-processing protein TSR2 homolog n=1 Tax=Terrapene triunguis TaxID=2587831 RepID=A0A674IMA0_9SAUR